MVKKVDMLKKVFRFYYEGFKNMKVGKKLWLIIFAKLFIMFFILKIFFFKNFLNHRFSSDKEKSEYVLDELTKRSPHLNNKNIFKPDTLQQ